MKRGPGRPKSENPRDQILTLRLTRAELRALRAAAHEEAMPVGPFLRKLLAAFVAERPTRKDRTS